MRTRSYAIVSLFLLCVPTMVGAQLVVTEIMYNPEGADTGREWIEVYNTGTTDVRLTDWRLFEGSANHKITSISGGDTIGASAYAVIATNAEQFRADYTDFSGHLFHSSFSLGNSGDTIILRDKNLKDIDTVSYQNSNGASGDGNSLQRSTESSAFVARTPSPGDPISPNAIPPKVKPTPPPKPTKNVSSKKSVTAKGVAQPTTLPMGSVDSQDGTTPVSSDMVEPAQEVTAAAEVPTSKLSGVWIFALLVLMVASVGALLAFRHFKKREWDIIEET